MIVQVIVPPIPAELIVLAAASKYGIILTTLFAGSGLFLGSIFVYFFGNYLSRFFPSKKVRLVSKKFEKFGFWILFVRILPYNPSDIISYVAGILKYDLKKYLFITFFVTFVRVLVLAVLGSYVESLKDFFYIFNVLFISGFVISFLMYRK